MALRLQAEENCEATTILRPRAQIGLQARCKFGAAGVIATAGSLRHSRDIRGARLVAGNELGQDAGTDINRNRYHPATERELSMNTELEIIDIEPGDGKAVVKGALITTQYRGFLEDGTQFDSSYERGKPFQCVIGSGRVIKGWDQGLMGMKVGGKRQLRVPAHLAYGERQIGALIKPNSNLMFEIELLEVLTRDD